MARLAHPNIVQIFDIGEEHGHPYIAFELVEGKTLANLAGCEPQPARARPPGLAGSDGPGDRLRRESARHCASQFEALQRPSRQQGTLCIVRFIKPIIEFTPFVIHARRGNVRPADDFDRAGPEDHGFQPGQGSGRQAGADLDRRHSRYPALHVARASRRPAQHWPRFGHLFTRRDSLRAARWSAPLQGTTPLETLKMVVSTEPVSPSQLRPALARDLVTICLKCLHKLPERRYETAGTLADDLRRFLDDEPIQAHASGRIEKTWRCTANPSIAALGACVLLVLVAGIVVSTYFAYSASREANKSSRLAKVARKADEARDDRDRAEAGAAPAREHAYRSDIRLLPSVVGDGMWFLFCALLDGPHRRSRKRGCPQIRVVLLAPRGESLRDFRMAQFRGPRRILQPERQASGRRRRRRHGEGVGCRHRSREAQLQGARGRGVQRVL